VKKLGAEKLVEYIAFDYDACKRLVELAPNAKVYYLNGDKNPAEVKKDGLYGLDYHFNVFKKNPTWIKEAHDLGLAVNVWTVNTKEEIDNVLRQQVEYMTTDKPVELSHISKHNKRASDETYSCLNYFPFNLSRVKYTTTIYSSHIY